MRRWWHPDDLPEGADEEDMAPGGEIACENGCTCRARPVRPTDIDPPEVTVDKWCPVHGLDPDEEYERRRDERMERDA